MKAQFIHHVASTAGLSILQQVAGLGRQVLIAAYFGLSREFDGYLVAYAVASMLVFNLSSVFDTIAVARLAQLRERAGNEPFWQASNRLLLQATIGGGLFAVVLIATVYIAMPVVAAGFAPGERARLLELAFYFIPWIIVIVPYYAVTAHLKALWRFHVVFIAEIATIVVSILVLFVGHDSIYLLPLAYAVGYMFALLGLMVFRGMMRTPQGGRSLDLIGDMSSQYLSNQLGGLSGFVDRYFQSFLMAGGISALGYVGQIVNSLSSLLTFREIYVLPLSMEAGRNEKIVRMLSGIVFVSVPVTCFIVAFAEPIIQLLFERGRFSAVDTRITASILQLMALSLLFSPLIGPMIRLLQILGRISYNYLINLVLLFGTAGFQYLFVFRLDLDVFGVALANIVNGVVLTIFVAALVRRCEIIISWSIVISNAFLAAVTCLVALAGSKLFTMHLGSWTGVLVGGGVYWSLVTLAYFAMRQRLRLIVGSG